MLRAPPCTRMIVVDGFDWHPGTCTRSCLNDFLTFLGTESKRAHLLWSKKFQSDREYTIQGRRACAKTHGELRRTKDEAGACQEDTERVVNHHRWSSPLGSNARVGTVQHGGGGGGAAAAGGGGGAGAGHAAAAAAAPSQSPRRRHRRRRPLTTGREVKRQFLFRHTRHQEDTASTWTAPFPC